VLRWMLGVVVFGLVEVVQFGLPCSMDARTCIILAAPLSLAIAVALLAPRAATRRRAAVLRIAVALLGILGAPMYFLGHICG
jgi:hypothetical protein